MSLFLWEIPKKQYSDLKYWPGQKSLKKNDNWAYAEEFMSDWKAARMLIDYLNEHIQDSDLIE